MISTLSVIAEPPDLMKIDGGSSEYCTIVGARSLLKRFRLDLIVEIHRGEIEQVRGILHVLCRKLAAFGYESFDLKTGRETTPEGCSTPYETEAGELLALMQLRVPETLKAFYENHRLQGTFDLGRAKLWQNLSHAGDSRARACAARASQFPDLAPQHPDVY